MTSILRLGLREEAATECDFFGAGARFHHVGLAVDSIRAAHPTCEVIANETQGVSMAFLRLHGMTVELLEPLGDDSPITRSLRQGVKLLHLCFEVPDLETALGTCRPAGFHRISTPLPVPEFDDRRIAWVFSKQFGLIELVERKAGAGGSDAIRS